MTTTRSAKASAEPTLPLNMRIKPSVRNLIDRAAELVGKNRTDSMLEASERWAEEILLDRAEFTASPDTYAEFLARLDVPAVPNARLKRTMTAKAPWDGR